MQYETKYRVLRTNGEIVEGEYIQTKGNDEDWPTFRLGDGSLLGVSREKVLGEVTNDCPPRGIDRIDEEELDRVDCHILDLEAEEARYAGYEGNGGIVGDPIISIISVAGEPASHIRCSCGAEGTGTSEMIETWYKAHVTNQPEIAHERTWR